MIYRNGIYYDKMIRNGVVYDRMVRNGVVYGGGEEQIDPSLEAVLDYATGKGYTIPSETYIVAMDALYKSIKRSGAWDRMDVLYLFTSDGSDSFRLINIINPLLYEAGMLNTTRTAYGYNGNGTNAFINTRFNPVTANGKYLQDDAHRMVVVSVAPTATTGKSRIDGLEGILSTSNHMMLMSQAAQRINQGATVTLNSAVDLSGTGMTSIHRTSANDVVLQKKDVFYTRTAASQARTSANQIILSAGTSSANCSDGGVAAYSMGAALSQQMCIDLRDAFNTYFTAVGLDPIA